MRPWLFVGGSEGLIALAAQTQFLPDNLISILAQLPLVAVIIWLQLQNQKWLEHMLAVQRESLNEIYAGQSKLFEELYAGQSKFFEALIDRLSVRQDELVKILGDLEGKISIMNATLGEAVNVRDVVDQLMDRLPHKRGTTDDIAG